MSLTQYYTATTLDGFITDPDNSLEGGLPAQDERVDIEYRVL